MDKKVVYQMLMVYSLVNGIHSEAKCDARQWYLKSSAEGLFDPPLSEEQESVQYDIENILLQSRKDPDKKQVECSLLLLFDEVLRKPQVADERDESEIDETDILEEEGMDGHMDAQQGTYTTYEESDIHNLEKFYFEQSQKVETEGNEDIKTKIENDVVQQPSDTFTNLHSNSIVEHTSINFPDNKDQIDQQKEEKAKGQNMFWDETNVEYHKQEHIAENNPDPTIGLTNDITVQNIVSQKIEDKFVPTDFADTTETVGLDIQTDAKITESQPESLETKTDQQNQYNNFEYTGGETTREGTKDVPKVNDISVLDIIEGANDEQNVNHISVLDNNQHEDVVFQESNIAANIPENNVRTVSYVEQRIESGVQETINPTKQDAQSKGVGYNIYRHNFGVCHINRSSISEIFLSRYLPQTTKNASNGEPSYCTNCIDPLQSTVYVNNPITPDSDVMDTHEPSMGIQETITDDSFVKEQESHNANYITNDIPDLPVQPDVNDKDDYKFKDIIKEQPERLQNSDIEKSDSEIERIAENLRNKEHFDVNECKEKLSDNTLGARSNEKPTSISDQYYLTKQETPETTTEVKAEVRDTISSGRQESKYSQPTNSNINQHSNSLNLNSMNDFLSKTLEYSSKIQNLELLIMKLENQLLVEKLDKQNHSSTITRLENSILKLENELLKLNNSHHDLKMENEYINKNKKKFLELDHVPPKTLANENLKNYEVITEQQNKIMQLADLLKNQSKAIHHMKTKYEYLEDQNRMLFQMVLNQTAVMTQMMSRVQELAEQNMQHRMEAQTLKEKIALSTLSGRPNNENISKVSVMLMEKLDAFVSDKKLDTVENVRNSNKTAEEKNKDTNEKTEEELHNYLRTKKLADISYHWCGRHNMICIYKSIVMSRCVPFVPLFWSLCEAYSAKDTTLPKINYVNDKRKPIQNKNEKESNKPTFSLETGGKPTLEDVKDRSTESKGPSLDTFVQESDDKIIQIAKTENNPTKAEFSEFSNTPNAAADTRAPNKDNQDEKINASGKTVDIRAANKDNEEEKIDANVKDNTVSEKSAANNEDINQEDKRGVGVNQNENDKQLGDGEEKQMPPPFTDDKQINGKTDGEQKQEPVNEKHSEKTSNDHLKEQTNQLNVNKPLKLDGVEDEKIEIDSIKEVQHKQKSTEQNSNDTDKKEILANSNGTAETEGNKKESPVLMQHDEEKEKIDKEQIITKPDDSKSVKEHKNLAQQDNDNKHVIEQKEEAVKRRKLRYQKNDQKEPKDCYDHYLLGNRRNAIYKIKPYGMDNSIQVYCDMTSGGWTVIQRRSDGTTKFFREWEEYKTGFGGPYGEHWIGNDIIHFLTNQDDYKLRIDLTDWNKTKKYAEYDFFSIEDEKEGYKLTINGYSGDAGDGMAKHNSHKFSTKDVDNDQVVKEFGGSCANRFSGAWWYYKCYMSNLNGLYYRNGQIPPKMFDGITWKPWTGSTYSLRSVEMKIRPSSAKEK